MNTEGESARREGLVQCDFFASVAARDEAVEAADARVASERGGDALVGRVTERLRRDYPVGTRFTADVIALLLDDAGVARDQATRRRLVSTIVSRGRNKLWRFVAYTISEDARRKARPVALWEMV